MLSVFDYWKCLLFFFGSSWTALAFAQVKYDPNDEVTALVKVIAYERTGNHIASGNVKVQVEEVLEGNLRDSIVSFDELEDRVLVDKIFRQGVSQKEIVEADLSFVLKFSYYDDAFTAGGPYYVIWSAKSERRKSLEILENLLAVYNEENDIIPQFLTPPFSFLQYEQWGRLSMSIKDQSLILIETELGSGEWLTGKPKDGYIHQSNMDVELLKKEKDFRIIYERDSQKKVLHRQNPWSDYWFTAIIIETDE